MSESQESLATLSDKDTATQNSFYNTVAQAIYKLHAGYESGDRAALAKLRNAAGKTPQTDPLAWSLVLETLLPDFAYAGQSDSPNQAEKAAFTALTLYALHQRTMPKNAHQIKQSLGTAAAELTKITKSKSIKSRFDAVIVANSATALNYHLRSLIGLFNANKITLDYALLASDLWALNTKEKRQGVILRWTRDYAITLFKN